MNDTEFAKQLYAEDLAAQERVRVLQYEEHMTARLEHAKQHLKELETEIPRLEQQILLKEEAYRAATQHLQEVEDAERERQNLISQETEKAIQKDKEAKREWAKVNQGGLQWEAPSRPDTTLTLVQQGTIVSLLNHGVGIPRIIESVGTNQEIQKAVYAFIDCLAVAKEN